MIPWEEIDRAEVQRNQGILKFCTFLPTQR